MQRSSTQTISIQAPPSEVLDLVKAYRRALDDPAIYSTLLPRAQ